MATFRRWSEMKLYRYIWAWQLLDFEDHGWWHDGGIWPRLRVVRRMREDEFYDHPSLQDSEV